MVIMTDTSPSKAEEKEDASTYFILDETGDTSIDLSVLDFQRLEPKDKIRGKESGTSEVESGEEWNAIDESRALKFNSRVLQPQQPEPKNPVIEEETGSSEEIETGEVFETVDENLGQSSSDGSSMRSRLVPRSSIGGTTPRSSANTRRRGSKRKRRQTFSTPVITKKTKPSPGTPGNATKKKKRKNKKSVIVVDDSDSEKEKNSPRPSDISVVEIDDESSSIIVLSDDEVGVCSGSLSTTKKPLQPRNIMDPQPFNVAQSQAGPAKPQPCSVKPLGRSSPTKNAPAVEDLTGNYITKKPDDPQAKKHFELYRPQADNSSKSTGLRPIVIDGCNVAFGHGRDRFSSLGLKICVDYFKSMGHEVRAFVPQFRKTHSATVDPQLLDAMEKDGTLSFTPSRRTDGKMIVSYDDRFIVQYADATGGIIVSRDNYRDLLNENPEYKETIHKRLLMFTWVGDTIMFPKDPLGRGGPTLQEFLKF